MMSMTSMVDMVDMTQSVGKMEPERLPKARVPRCASLFIVALACAVAFALLAAMAAAPQDAYADEGEATLTLVLKHEENGSVNTIPGAEFTAYQVARIGAGNAYELVAPFDSSDVDFNQPLTASQMAETALAMAEAVAGQAGAKTATSGDDGNASFGALDMGVYLVVQTGATGEAENYYEMDPFLVNVPQLEGGTATFDVVAVPKPELKPVVDPEESQASAPKKTTNASPSPSRTTAASTTSAPRTGDSLGWELMALAAIVGVIAMCVALYTANRRRE